jgi:hypothetical protein
MTRARTLRSLWFAVLPLAGAVIFCMRASVPDAPSVTPAAPAPARASTVLRATPRSPAPAAASRPVASTVVAGAPQPEEPLELRDDLRSRGERARYYDARSQYEAEMAAALRRIASELSDEAADGQDEPAVESEHGAHDVNVEALSARIGELEAEAERHAQRSTRYAAAR